MKVVLRAGIALAGLVSAATMASAGSSLKDIDITTKSISQDSENSSPVTNIGTISSICESRNRSISSKICDKDDEFKFIGHWRKFQMF